MQKTKNRKVKMANHELFNRENLAVKQAGTNLVRTFKTLGAFPGSMWAMILKNWDVFKFPAAAKTEMSKNIKRIKQLEAYAHYLHETADAYNGMASELRAEAYAVNEDLAILERNRDGVLKKIYESKWRIGDAHVDLNELEDTINRQGTYSGWAPPSNEAPCAHAADN